MLGQGESVPSSKKVSRKHGVTQGAENQEAEVLVPAAIKSFN